MNTLEQLAVLVAVFLVAVGALAYRRRMFAKMSARNIARRKRYSVIVILGLLIATAMISSSLVVGDTLDYIITKDVMESTGHVDIVIIATDETGEVEFFNASVLYALQANMTAGRLPHVDGAAGAIREVMAVQNLRTGKAFARAGLFGFDPENTVNDLLKEDGDRVSAADVTGGRFAINPDLAGEVDAVPGDTLMVVTGTGGPRMLEVSLIVQDTGMGRWQWAAYGFVDLTYAQEQIFGEPGRINVIDVSCAGPAETGYRVTDEAVAELKENLPSEYTYTYDTVKRDGVEMAESTGSQVSDIFIIMSSFAIIAGVALIVNIFVMLAEERKAEMGISRAIGMQRGDLTQTFMFEGIVYALVAAGVGAFVGLGIAVIIMSGASAVISGGDLEFTLHFEWVSLGIAACAGFLVTALTVVGASWRVSKLNIVRAIRDIPEPVMPRTSRKYLALGLGTLGLGVLVTIGGFTAKQDAFTTTGPCLTVLGLALVSSRFVKLRVPISLAGLFTIVWTIDPYDFTRAIFGETKGAMEMFIISGILLVSGGVIIVIFNSDLMLEGMMRVFGRRRSLLPVFKTAISYPMNKKFRTGLTLFMFSLIVFTVIVIAMIASFQRESVTKITSQLSGGYETLGFSIVDIDQENMTAGVAQVNDRLGEGAVRGFQIASMGAIQFYVPETGKTHDYTMTGFPDSLLMDSEFSLMRRASEYATDAEAWAALASNHSLVIMDGSVVPSMFGATTFSPLSLDIGQRLTLRSYTGAETDVTIIGIMDQSFITSVYTSSSFTLEFVPTARSNLYYFDTAPPADVTDAEIAKQLETQFVSYGLSTIVLKDTVEQIMSMVASIMQLMEIFLGIGLVVGIAGLGIITIRNVAERKQEIGVMRAIGFQRDMVLKSFLLETSYVSLLGIVMGVILGLALSWKLFEWGGFAQTSEFVIPWFDVALVLTVAFVVTLLATLPPSLRAARLAPAEALRRVD